MKSRNVVITGVSSGIGLATAQLFIKKGYKVFGSLRNEKDAISAQSELGDMFVPLLFDVTDPNAIAKAVEKVRSDTGRFGICALVNNAGTATTGGPLSELSADEIRWQMEVNLIGTIQVTNAFLPLLGKDYGTTLEPGRVVNINSDSAWITVPGMVPYCMSKAAMRSWSEGLRRELGPVFGIKVISIEPGIIQTQIWDKGEQIDFTRFEHSPYSGLQEARKEMLKEARKIALPATKVAEAVLKSVTDKHPKPVLVVHGEYLLGYLLPKYMPTTWLDKILAWKFKIARKKTPAKVVAEMVT